MNVRRIRNLAKFIEEKVPRRLFNMDNFVHNRKDCVTDKTNFTACGTSCCIAGWEAIRRGKKLSSIGGYIISKNVSSDPTPSSIAHFAQNSLGLPAHKAISLFYSWPTKDGEDMFKKTPKGAAKRLLYFIDTGE